MSDPRPIIESGDRAASVGPDEFPGGIARILERIGDAIYGLDKDWRFTYANPQFERLYSRRRAEMIGRDIREVFPEAVGGHGHEAHIRAFRTGRTVSYETRAAALGGRWIEATIYPDATGVSVYVRDIEDRKRAELALQDSEARYRTLVEHAAVGVAHATLDGRWTMVNQACCDILGYTREALIGRRFQDLTHPDDLAADLDLIRALDAGEIPSFSREKRYIRKDGSLVWVSVTVSVVRHVSNAPSHRVVVIQDIDERKRTEAALRESMARNRWLLESTTEAIWRIEFEPPIPTDLPENEQIARIYRDRRLMECNDGMARIYGFAGAAEMVNLRLDDIMPEAEATNRNYLRAFIRGGYRVIDAESIDVTRDGRTIHALNSLVGEVENGHLMRAWGTARDVTDRRRAEEALRESEARYRSIVEAANEGIWLVDAEARTLFVNQRMAAMLGCAPEEVIGRTITEFASPEDAPLHHARIARNIEGRAERFQTSFRRKDGREVPVLAGTSAIRDPDGRIIGALGMFSDITEQKRTEARLRDSEQRERARAAELATVLDTVPAVVWIAHDRDCHVITGNRASYEFLRLPYGTNESKSAPDHRPTDHFAVFADGVELAPEDLPIQRAARGEEVRGFEETVVFRDGTARHLYGDAVPLRDGDGAVRGAVGAFLDITERKHAEEALARSRADLDDFFENAAVALHWVGPDGTILRANQAEIDLLGYAREDYIGRNIAEFHADRSTIDDILARLSRGETLARYPARLRAKDGSIRHVRITSNALRRDGRFVHTRCFTIDVTEQTRAEEHQKRLMAELNHRVKNTLAVVQGIAAQTLRRAASPEGFAESFNGRLQALAAAHGLLSEGAWRATQLTRLIARILKAHGTRDQALELSGPDLALSPKQALALSLVLHELATNATKYGALSVPGGRLALAWALADAGGVPRFEFDWIERGGPPVQAPATPGFGTILIRHTMTYDLDGEAAFHYEPAGLRCRLVLPWHDDQIGSLG